MDFSPAEIRWIFQAMIILLLSIAVHEFGHAIVAHKLGDRLPSSQGRVTLNPIAHASPIGTLLFPLLSLVFFKAGGVGGGTIIGRLGFGWGKPVQVNPVAFSRRFQMRTGHLFVAAAGPGMNVLFGTFIACVHAALLAFGVLTPASPINGPLAYAVFINFILCFFNFLPCPPLDGGAVLEGVLPEKWLPAYRNVAGYGMFLIMAVIFIPGMFLLISAPAKFCTETIYRLLGHEWGQLYVLIWA